MHLVPSPFVKYRPPAASSRGPCWGAAVPAPSFPRATRVMKRVIALMMLGAGPLWAMDVPSGQPVELQEVLVDDLGGETWVRFRFVAPRIGVAKDALPHAVVVDDMAHLCVTLALPYMGQYALEGDVIVVSLADRSIDFGETNPDVTQYFEAFRPVDNTCIWEAL